MNAQEEYLVAVKFVKILEGPIFVHAKRVTHLLKIAKVALVNF